MTVECVTSRVGTYLVTIDLTLLDRRSTPIACIPTAAGTSGYTRPCTGRETMLDHSCSTCAPAPGTGIDDRPVRQSSIFMCLSRPEVGFLHAAA